MRGHTRRYRLSHNAWRKQEKNDGRNLEANTQVKSRGVDIGSSDGSVIDLSGNDDEPDGGVYHVKQESVIVEEASGSE